MGDPNQPMFPAHLFSELVMPPGGPKFWLYVGAEDVGFEISKDIVHSHSPVLKAKGACHLVKDYTMDHIQSLVDFMYARDYRFAEAVLPMSGSDHSAAAPTNPQLANVDGSAAIFHLEMTTLAREYEVEWLGELALQKFWQCIQQHSIIPSALPKVIAAAYKHSDDENLHQALLNLVLGQTEAIIEEEGDNHSNNRPVPWDFVVRILARVHQGQEAASEDDESIDGGAEDENTQGDDGEGDDA